MCHQALRATKLKVKVCIIPAFNGWFFPGTLSLKSRNLSLHKLINILALINATSIKRFGDYMSKCTDEKKKQGPKLFEKSKTLTKGQNDSGLQRAWWHKLTTEINSTWNVANFIFYVELCICLHIGSVKCFDLNGLFPHSLKTCIKNIL